MREIKVTHINPTDIKGGASLAGYRLHKELLKHPEINSVLFVDKKYTKDKKIVKFSNVFLRQIEKIFNKFGYLTGLQYIFSLNWLPLFFKKRFRETDIFIIRMLHGGYLPFWLPWILSKVAPVIWRLPDMWAFTGHCAYSYDCQKWQEICRKCPHLKEYPALLLDTTSFLFKLKKFFYSRSRLYVVTPSKWMFENVKNSPILKNSSVFYIPTGVNHKMFYPSEKKEKLTLIFVVANLKDKRKGIYLLPEIFSKLNQKLKEQNIFIDAYCAGENSLNLPQLSNINYIFLGYLKEKELAEYFAKSHIYILPTLADNLPNTLLESLASGTPAVSFNVGGCKDVVRHMETGYLASPFDVDDFVKGITNLLENPQKLAEMSRKARQLILTNFTMEKQAENYLKLIKNIVKNKNYGKSS